MDRNIAAKMLRAELDKHELKNWGVRISNDPNQSYLGICVHKDKVIILNAFHIDIHPDAEVTNTILHELAHAIVGPGHGHDDTWVNMAHEVGCDNTLPCSHLSLPEHVIDAIRSGQMVEMTVEEETQVIRRPKYTVTRLQDKCPECGKVAKELFSYESVSRDGISVRMITLECFHIVKKVIPRGTPFHQMVSNDWKENIKSCKHDWDKNSCKSCGEFRLFNFQVIGAQAIESGLSTQKGFGDFDDMGLGKTVQALAVIKYHPELTPTLYITKSNIKYQWYAQLVRWLGPDYMAQVISTSKDYVIPGLKSYIIPYDLLRRFPKEKLAILGIKCVVIDECQQIKNPDSARTQGVRKLVGDNEIKVISLSGTPWKNRGGEFFPILNIMDPIKFYSHQHYLDTWVDFYYDGPKKKQGGIRNIPRFKEFTKSLLIRREYNEVMDEFPEINRMKLDFQLDELSQSTYDDEVSIFVKWYNDAVIGGTEDSLNGIQILAKMARMRHILGLAKIPATLGFVEEFIEDTDKKLVIFVHHKDVGQIMYNALNDTNEKSNKDFHELASELVENGIKVFKYTSELSDIERYEMQMLFNKTPRAIMVASTLACGEGVDLQTCADAIMHERQWNPQNEDQAAPGRFRRIGQLASVINITFPEAVGTFDEDLDGMVSEKRRNFHAVMNTSKEILWDQNDIAKKLAEIIVRKHREKKSRETNITKVAQLSGR
jgi:hypothetical protein